MEQKILWKPTKKQSEALIRQEFEILFGGARGGGKSDCGIAWLLYDSDKPDFRALVIRRNADDLKDWIDRAETLYSQIGAKSAGNPREFKFPSGAVIRTGHLKDDQAYTKYQGHEYHRMVIEELTHITTEEKYLKLVSSCRSTNKELIPQVFCTTNPGSAGHAWVKKRWNIDDRPMKNIITLDPITQRKRIFIPSLITDNPFLIENDPSYVQFLESLPQGLKEQWRYGYWEDVEIKGAYYSKYILEAQRQGRITSVPYDHNLEVDTYWDLGVNDTTTIWFVQQYGKEVRIIEAYENEGEGLPFYVELIKKKPYRYGRHYFPHDLRVQEMGTGRTREDILRDLGVRNYVIIERADINDGIEAVRNILPSCWFDEEKTKDGVYALKSYHKEWDDKNLVYRNHPCHDWSSNYADAFRYLAGTIKLAILKKEKPKYRYRPVSSLLNV